MDKLNRVFSTALDIIENELLGVSRRHSVRVAILAAAMGRRLGMAEPSLTPLTTCALFHDNALTEYILSERPGANQPLNLRLHCEYGQNNIEWLPFPASVENFILHHHELADGGGPFGKKEGECPLEAELIAIADMVDVGNPLDSLAPEKLPALRWQIEDRKGSVYTRRATDALLAVLDAETLASLREESIASTIEKHLPAWEVESEDPAIMCAAGFITHIIDYKSTFTEKHTMQIANRSWIMGSHYGYDEIELARLFLAATLHDIGKIATPLEILEKPGPLSADEFAIIKLHALHTHEWLGGVQGLEDIHAWAANHHEKLDGSGYPLGKKAAELDFNSRLLACLDIYQAVSEKRPYHPRRGHGDTMPILRDMAQKNLIDREIVEDLDRAMAEYSNLDVPPPPPLRKAMDRRDTVISARRLRKA
ncbi:MAG: HD domain-containing protein [Planctomycetota bacterium]|nr:HD domain-containing protein [Planctomycetota bacterium]